MKNTKTVSMCAMLCALGTVMLYIGSAFQIIDLSVCAIAALIVAFAVWELGIKSAVSIWLVTSLLSLLLVPNKYIATVYAAYVGLYPILKYLFEHLPKLLCVICKFLSLNIVLTVFIMFAIFVFKTPDKLIWFILLYPIANLTLFVFDILLDRLLIIYDRRLRERLGISKFLNK